MELKPCPFCGEEAEIRTEYGYSDRPLRFVVSCQSFTCGATITKRVCVRGPRPPKGTGLEQLDRKYQLRFKYYRDWCNEQEQNAIKAWNRREEAEKALEEVRE